ncbi:MAG: hypothetical protein RR220_10110, partial [Bacteroidaceae bacterium]
SYNPIPLPPVVVGICFQISIFERLETASFSSRCDSFVLVFAFKLVSLSDWKQPFTRVNP